MVEVGQEAPDFTLPDQEGKEVTLSELQGQPVVLYFYPKAETLGGYGSRRNCSGTR
jgi:peroxiredoxin Q/BCP